MSLIKHHKEISLSPLWHSSTLTFILAKFSTTDYYWVHLCIPSSDCACTLKVASHSCPWNISVVTPVTVPASRQCGTTPGLGVEKRGSISIFNSVTLLFDPFLPVTMLSLTYPYIRFVYASGVAINPANRWMDYSQQKVFLHTGPNAWKHEIFEERVLHTHTDTHRLGLNRILITLWLKPCCTD